LDGTVDGRGDRPELDDDDTIGILAPKDQVGLSRAAVDEALHLPPAGLVVELELTFGSGHVAGLVGLRPRRLVDRAGVEVEADRTVIGVLGKTPREGRVD